MPSKYTPEERFWAKVNKTDSCWLWTASKNGSGYGQFWDGTRFFYAHRFSYELLVGPIPEGLELDHLCRVHACVNSMHLEAVSHRENTLRGTGASARNAARTHCAHGHLFDETNTIHDRAKGWRSCRECRQARLRRPPRQMDISTAMQVFLDRVYAPASR